MSDIAVEDNKIQVLKYIRG